MNSPLVVPLGAIPPDRVAEVGGKAANLAELLQAGFRVPRGCCLTTEAYERAVGRVLDPILDALAATAPTDAARLDQLAARARLEVLGAPVPKEVVDALVAAVRALGRVPLAVRSSGTAEDLPHASFAGQQDTLLDVVGATAVIEAVRRCWASLWTTRAVAYRAHVGIDPRSVRLAVVIQEMAEAVVSGVLFTADPVAGTRHRAVIEASAGLGEAVVSGAVDPDRFVVDTATGSILERKPGDTSLTDDQVRALATLGDHVEAHFGVPQDLEWAIDVAGRIQLLQARPITTLFPLPAAPDGDLRVYFSINVAQGVFRPLTPMGRQAFRLLGAGMGTLVGHRTDASGILPMVEAAGRLFADVTPAIRSRVGRRWLDVVTRQAEARSFPIVRALADDPRLAPLRARPLRVARAVLSFAVRGRVVPRMLEALVSPGRARDRALRVERELREDGRVPTDASPDERLRTAERLLLEAGPRIVPAVAPVFGTGLLSSWAAGRLLGDLATEDERRVALRALPDNPTTQMDLALWALSSSVRADPDAARILRETPPEDLARSYLAGTLPPPLQTGLAEFLGTYGHRAVAEIDLGLPRWSEDPAWLFGVLAGYLQVDGADRRPDERFRDAGSEAREMVAELTRRATLRSPLRGAAVAFLLDRARALAGLRELPKFCVVLVLARVRELLLPVGAHLVAIGRLEDVGDVFFLTLSEARDGLGGRDLRRLVLDRREDHARELRRRHVPRVLLSDGTEPGLAQPAPTADGVLRGTAASGGIVTGRARVILDPAQGGLLPSEILVAPSTDPGWTPLFLTAAGLVMEMGGAISHGAVVAREYGIPAVVGVPDATTRIRTGQVITVDGATGTVTIEPGADRTRDGSWWPARSSAREGRPQGAAQAARRPGGRARTVRRTSFRGS